MRPTKTLIDARLDRGYSQTELAAGTGLTVTTINRLENGHAYPQHITRRILENTLGCHLKFDAPTKPIGRPQEFKRTK